MHKKIITTVMFNKYNFLSFNAIVKIQINYMTFMGLWVLF